MFYAILALLIFEPYSSSKHSGVLGYFNKHFIKEKILPEELGRTVTKAFELRQRVDYREYVELTSEQVGPFIKNAQKFVKTVREFIEKKYF
jgi:uncharacterized protein (UPF0332 family)